MNGATALDCEKTISSANRTKMTTIGASQYFFSCRRNCENSFSTLNLDMRFLSEHPLVVLRIARPPGERQPQRPGGALAQRIAAEQPAEDADRRDDEHEHRRQQNPRVHPAEQMANPVPLLRQRRERRRTHERRDDEHAA